MQYHFGIKVAFIALLVFGGLISNAQGFDHSQKDWTSLLEKYTSTKGQSTAVKYKEWKAQINNLNSYLKSVEEVSKSDFKRFTKPEQLSFLINAYNAFTVKLILDNYPTQSIKEIKTGFNLKCLSGKCPWQKKFFKMFGEEQNLDTIEHQFIRAQFNEPRIHFALVCASIGCPALRREAFTPEKLENQLNDASIQFLTDRTKNQYLVEKQTLELSSIFKWYGDDFVKKFGSLEAFIADKITSNPNHQQLIRSKKVPIKFLEYDWSLNE
jgi:hypothetical protein